MSESMRDDLNAALDAASEDDDTQNFEETPQEILDDANEETEETLAEGAEPKPEGDEPKGDEPKGDEPKPDSAAPDGSSEELGKESDEKPDTRSLKAPVDWSPKEREDWSKIPRHLQEKVMAREQAIQDTMQEAASDRKIAADFGKIASSYGPILQGVAGDTPLEAVENLFNTAAKLRMGTQQEKAQTIANLISQFDVDINSLDSAIVGEQNQNQDPQTMMREMIQREMAPMRNQYDQQQQGQQRQLQDNAQTEVQNFGQNAEFLADVRHDMADLIDMAAKRGQGVTMQEAYDKACALNPQIQSVLQQRAEHERVTGGNNNMAGKRNAASSVTGHRGGGGGGGKPASLRDSIADAWDSQEN